MDTSSLTSDEADATLRAMEYWIGKWDWECPTLLGVELEELKTVVAHWPAPSAATKGVTALCASGAWRELLDGSAALPAEDVRALTGIGWSEAGQLNAKVLALAMVEIVLPRPVGVCLHGRG